MAEGEEVILAPRFPAALALTAFLCAGAARADEKAPVNWRGKTYRSDALPAEMAEAPRAAIAEWEAWAAQAGYRMDLDPDSRVLLIGRVKRSRVEKELEIVARARTWFDETLPWTNPPPAEANSAKSSSPPAGKSSDKSSAKKVEEIPEDPEGAPPVLAPPKGSQGGSPGGSTRSKSADPKSATEPTAWGSGSSAPDSRTAVLMALADEEDQESALQHLARNHPDLASWAANAGRDQGFVLELPLLAAYLENASGQEEWDPDHEVLNRLVRLWVLGRFGQMPNWIMHALAWEAETAYDGSIWVYPYRSEFVYTTEHTAWPLELAHEFEDRAKNPLQIEELTGWSRGTWDGARARHAFGLIRYLATAKKSALPAVLADLRAHRDEANRKSAGSAESDTWVRNANWESPPAVQLAILRARCGENVLSEASAWLAKQKGSKSRSALQEASDKTQHGRR